MRRTLVLLIAAAILAAGWTLPTTAEVPTHLAPIADYLHQVIEASPMPAGSLGILVRQVDEATAAPTCERLAPVLDRAAAAARRRVGGAGVPEAELKALVQIVTYAGDVDRLCGTTPR